MKVKKKYVSKLDVFLRLLLLKHKFVHAASVNFQKRQVTIKAINNSPLVDNSAVDRLVDYF